MAKTNWQDPKTSEIISPHISGLQEAVGKIEESIGIETISETNIPLSEVYIADDDRCRIYQAPEGKRNWVSSPAPIIKKNGTVITTGFTIDYGGGAVIFSTPLLKTNTLTSDVTYTKIIEGKQLSSNDYTTDEKEKLEGIETGAQKNTVVSVAGKTGAVKLSKNDIGLNNVENIRQANKTEFDEHKTDNVRHVTATERTAWNAKETPSGAQERANVAEGKAKAYADTHIDNKDNPHSVTKAQVGLGNITNEKQMPESGGHFTGNVTFGGFTRVTPHAHYTQPSAAPQVRNILISPNSADLNKMFNGDIWIKYK